MNIDPSTLAQLRAAAISGNPIRLVTALPGFGNEPATQEQVHLVEFITERPIEGRELSTGERAQVNVGRLRAELKRWATREHNALLDRQGPGE